MIRAIELARRPPFTSPNPRVGAVVVRDGVVLGEGWHRGPGTPHAEPDALRDLDAAGATLYVTLEPCAHHGRTPPCAPAVAASGVRRVVAALEDPDPRVAGAGFDMLRAAGVEVEVGACATEARRLNAAYVHHRSTGRAFVSLKLALTLDGRLAAPDGTSRWITGDDARRIVHRRRVECDAVMVGAGTVLADDPRLDVRAVDAPRQPARVVVDGSGRVPPTAALFSSPGGAVTVATTDAATVERRKEWEATGAEVLVLPRTGDGVDLDALLEDLGARGVVEVLCEGGARLATRLLERRLVGRLELHHGAVVVGRGGPDVGDVGVATMAGAYRWRLVSVERADDDVVATYEPDGGR
ncbi:MAG TPA: bifunctional diaminohydroxyphosphoribosylaminopyrimidine deaminase/5-amino-6-(5-phosphoribosylamino)uracil reductase RibD [Actinomycetota bacterium]|nr:bifunctional diaminohydroxyphosphoribosylaminopyrimidine deaminase/5-amino-6-(5-phosphoribosylamino)uracil reductase RibD [Actinomycetota bacterium]